MDLGDDVLPVMHGRWPSLREPDKALAYLGQTVVNRSRSVLRHRGLCRPGGRPPPPATRPPAPTRPPWPPSTRSPSSTRCARCPTGSARCSPCATTWTCPRRRSPHARHQPGCREEPRVPRRRRPAHPDGGRLMNDDQRPRPARRRRLRRRAPRRRSTAIRARTRRPRAPAVGLGRRRRRARHRRDGGRAVAVLTCGPSTRTRHPARAGRPTDRRDLATGDRRGR